MSSANGTAIEDVSQGRIEARIREVARRFFADQNVDDLETRHLAQVVEHCSRAISDVYCTANLNQILRGETTRPEGPEDLLNRISGSARTPLRRVTRVPEELKEVGDRCLYDIGMAGVRDYHGLSLETLGIRSYGMAAEILSILADERELRELFRRNRVSTLPIEKEVEFLRRCAARFHLHAHLLSNLRDDPAPAPAVVSPAPSPVREASTGEGVEEGRVPPERSPGAFPAGAATPGARPYPRERLLSRYERLLLLANTDIEKVRRELKGLVIEQDEAVDSLCDGLLLDITGARTDGRPLSYSLVGPAGVGKKHLMKSLARILEACWKIEIPFLAIEGTWDASSPHIERQEGAAADFAHGAEPWVLEGFHERASRSPLAILIVDNPEKIPPRFSRLLLSILDRGIAQDSRGRELIFEGWILAFTSNRGGSCGKSLKSILHRRRFPGKSRRREEEAERRLGKAFSPETAGRLRILRFFPLSPASMEAILELELTDAVARFRSLHDLQVKLTPRARRRLIEIGFTEAQGARPLAAAVRRHCGVEVSRKIKQDEIAGDSGREETIRHLREIRRGERAFEPETVERTVLRQVKVRLPYRTVVIDESGGEFRYRGER